jgi:hypothetical protein
MASALAVSSACLLASSGILAAMHAYLCPSNTWDLRGAGRVSTYISAFAIGEKWVSGSKSDKVDGMGWFSCGGAAR